MKLSDVLIALMVPRILDVALLKLQRPSAKI